MYTEQNFNVELVADRVRELMEENGISKRNQVSQLSQILGLSFSQAHRKMKGQSPWTLTQIKDVAASFGAAASTLIDAPAQNGSDQLQLGLPQECMLVIESPTQLQCLARIGQKITSRKKSAYVASNANDQWRIYPAENAPSTSELFSVDLIEISPQTSTTEAHIAVVDDESGSADTLCDYLNENGFRACTFYNIASFKSEYQKNVNGFDAFVIDWWLGGETAEQCIREIREMETSHIPIILLTGELKSGKASEDDIGRLMRQCDITCLEKPIRLSLLVENLAKELRQR